MAWAAIVVPATVAVLGGLATVVWRMGGLMSTVESIGRRVARIEGTLDAQEVRARRKGEWPTAPPSESPTDPP